MGSLHNDLAVWANKARASGLDTIEIDLKDAEAASEAIRCRNALDEVLGGIHDIIKQVVESLEPHDEGNGYGSIPGESIDALMFVLHVSDWGTGAENAQVQIEALEALSV